MERGGEERFAVGSHSLTRNWITRNPFGIAMIRGEEVGPLSFTQRLTEPRSALCVDVIKVRRAGKEQRSACAIIRHAG